MRALAKLTSIAASLPEENIDTDIIFPARFLLITAKVGLGQYAFYERRFNSDGTELHNFPLNSEPYRTSSILLAGDNFGCGSSREQAPWALLDLGYRCIVSTSFGEIFYANCFRNGMLPIVVTATQLALLQRQSAQKLPLTVDLEDRKLYPCESESVAFEIAESRRNALLNGWDEIALVINQDSRSIAQFEITQHQRMPWLY